MVDDGCAMNDLGRTRGVGAGNEKMAATRTVVVATAVATSKFTVGKKR